MAAYEFRLPDIGEGVAEGEVVQWFVQEGAEIREDAPLVSVLTDKANVEIPSPKAGRVVRLHAKVGEKVKVGAPLVTIEVAGDAGPGIPPAPAAPTEPAAPAAPAASASPAPASPPPSGSRVLASPHVRRLAAERGIDLAQVRATGPAGRITEADLEAHGGAPAAPESPAVPAPAATPPTPTATGGAAARPAEAGVERIPIIGVRRVIAERMHESRQRAAHFTYVEEVDATELVRWRERTAKHIEKRGVKLTYLPFIVKAVVSGLREFPRMNATMDDEHQELVVHRDFNIGIATAAPEGLIVPVVHNAERKSVATLAVEIQTLAERGKAGKLTRPELTGGTFTITSLGALGGVLATPILNYPEVGILGVHKISARPVVRPDGAIGVAQMMNLSVSLDHRVLDGIVGAQFLAVVKGALEDPHQLFAELA